MEKTDFPVQVVQIRDADYRQLTVRNGSKKMFGEVVEQTRSALNTQISQAYNHFSTQWQRWPAIPAVVKVILKREALAKSHRPLSLFTPRTCPIIGSLDFGEILVSATATGLQHLAHRIATTTAKTAIAGISTIESIQPYSINDGFTADDAGAVETWTQENRPLKLHLFSHSDTSTDANIESALLELAEELGIELEKITYGTRCTVFKTTSRSERIGELADNFIGLQSVNPMPGYRPTDLELQIAPVGTVNESLLAPPDPDVEYPTVGVVDSGICREATHLDPWLVGREEYVPHKLQDNSHGTMVAGLIAGARALNHGDTRFPEAQAKILDVAVFERDAILSEDSLVAILSDVIPKYPEVHVWNLSLALSGATSPSEFSDLACFLDELHDRYGCLFVISSGNHQLLQAWPQSIAYEGDRVASPGDSIRALTVGAIANAHKNNSLSRTEEPSPFSRCGPGPCFVPKPEVAHYGGNCTAEGNYAQTGILSIGPQNSLCESLGTSFSAPLVSAQAAALWQALDNQASACTPERIKALLIHSALLHSDEVSTSTVNHYGFGRPGDVIDALYCDPNALTLMFETDLRHGGHEFERWPFPIADCLLTNDGKFRGEMLMTLAYSPLTDNRFKSEYCRTNVEVGLGNYRQEEDETGAMAYKFNSFVPAAPKSLSQLFEAHQIEHGFKWSPVKAYYARFPQGKAFENCRLRMKVTRRAEELPPEEAQKATLLLTIRANAPDVPVYNDAIQLINRSGWVLVDIDQHLRIRI